MTTLPVWIWVLGAAVLAGVMAYGIMNNRRRTQREKDITEAATKKLYEREDKSA